MRQTARSLTVEGLLKDFTNQRSASVDNGAYTHIVLGSTGTLSQKKFQKLFFYTQCGRFIAFAALWKLNFGNDVILENNSTVFTVYVEHGN